MSEIQAIETRYAGCRFRSRLEARWAVFFDHLKIPWEYEAQGYEINGRRYLPDFRIDTFGDESDPILVEVKGEESRLDTDLIAATVRAVQIPLLILGPVPPPDRTKPYVHRFVLPMVGCCECGTCASWEAAAFQSKGRVGIWTTSKPFGTRWSNGLVVHRKVEDAYEAARSARFEHGESGAPAGKPGSRRSKKPALPTKEELRAEIAEDEAKVVLHIWEQAAGSDVTAHIRPESWRDGELVVRADSTAWATQLRLMAPELLRKMNELEHCKEPECSWCSMWSGRKPHKRLKVLGPNPRR